MAEMTEHDMNNINKLDNLLIGFEQDSVDLIWKKLDGVDDDLVDFTNWRVKVGSNVYAVHKAIIGDGKRQSKFFNTLFKRWDNNSKRLTDLSKMLPKLCRNHFEEILTYFYYTGEKKLHLSGKNVVSYFKIAHILQMTHLAKLCVNWMKQSFPNIRKTAIPMLQQAVILSPGALLDSIKKNCIDVCAKKFNKSQAEDFLILDAPSLGTILDEAKTKYGAEDRKICHAVTVYVRNIVGNDQTAVFLELSKHIFSIPKTAAKDAMYLLSKSIQYDVDRIKKLCITVVAENFKDVNHEDLIRISDHKTICDILDQNNLRVNSEDQVFDAIYNYCKLKKDSLTKAQMENIWCRCRFLYLSPKCTEKMLSLNIEEIPCRSLQLAFAGRNIQDRTSRNFKDFVENQNLLEGQRLTRRICNINEDKEAYERIIEEYLMQKMCIQQQRE